MDSVTQIVLGAAVGELIAGKSAGNKAAFWGGVCGTIPDLDVVAGQFMCDLQSNLFHRSISHSIIFFAASAPLLGLLIKKVHPMDETSRRTWSWLAWWSLFTHALLDCFTNWGTMLFWPVEWRVAFKSVFVIDPMYTLPLAVLLVLSLMKDRQSLLRRKLNSIGLIISSCYLLMTLINKQLITAEVEQLLAASGVNYHRIETKPAPLNNILWSANAETDSAYLITYRSFLDSSDDLNIQEYPKNHALIESIKDKPIIQDLIRLTNGWYAVEAQDNGFIVNDLRFGTVTGWEPGSEFVFAYDVILANDGSVSVNERDKGFRDRPNEILSSLWTRMLGN